MKTRFELITFLYTQRWISALSVVIRKKTKLIHVFTNSD